MLRLEVRPKERPARQFESEKSPVFLGRDRAMDLVLDDPLVSRQHAVIIARGSKFVLQDIGGRNPLRVNRSEVISHTLTAGDVIKVGDTEIVFSGDNASGQESIEDPAPLIVDAREALALFRRSGVRRVSSVEDTLPSLQTAETLSNRSDKNLRILQNFSDLIRNISDRQKLLQAALETVFDNLTVIRGFVGFFAPDLQLEIVAEKNRGRIRGRSYSHTIVERVRRDGVSILFCPHVEQDIAVGDSAVASSNGTDSVALGGADAERPAAPPQAEFDPKSSKSIVRLKIKSAMCLPIFHGEEVIGVLYLDNREASESFCQADLYFGSILSHLISMALEKDELYQQIQQENIELKSILHHKNRMVAVSSLSKELLRKIKKVAQFDTTVLISGESGTGKELVARAIHDRSPRRGSPFVAVNCAAIPETLLESELFGYVPDSGIAGSNPQGKPGKFELADGGTLFLDELGDMSLATQAKILRVLEERVVDRLGGQEGIPVDLRIVAATNKVLLKAVDNGEFREDLYYRLKVFKIELPPLRDRRDDILPLVQHFLSLYAQEGVGPLDLSPRAKELLLAYHWPGNIRELKNCIEQAVLLASGRTIYPENLPTELRHDDNPQPFVSLNELEAQHVARVLQSVNWNKRRAAQILGINRSTLYEKLRVYQIEKPADRPLASATGSS